MSNAVFEMVEAIKKKFQLENNAQVAREVNFDRTHLNKMIKRNGLPDAKNYLILAKKAGLNLDEALEKIEGGYADLTLLVTIALSGVVYFSGITQVVANPHVIELLNAINVYYVKWEIWRKSSRH